MKHFFTTITFIFIVGNAFCADADSLYVESAKLADSNPAIAEQLAKKCAAIALTDGNYPLAGKAYFMLGYLYDEKNHLLTATLRYLEALYYFDKSGKDAPKYEQLSALKNLGRIYRIAGRYRDAIKSYDRAIAMEPSADELAGLIYNKGFAYYSVKRYDSALYYFQESYLLSIEQKNYNRVGNNLNYIGLSHHYTGNQQLAREYFQKILAAEGLLGDKYARKASQSWHNIALTQIADGDSLVAGESFQKAMAIKLQLNDSASTFNTLLDAGELQLNLGQNEKAIDLLTQAENLYPAVLPDPEHFELFALLEKAWDGQSREKRNYYSDRLNEAWAKHWELHAQLSTENLSYQVERLEQEFIANLAEKEQKRRELVLLAVSGLLVVFIAALCVVAWRRRLKIRLKNKVLEAFGS